MNPEDSSLELMFEAMTDCVCIYDALGNIVQANTALRNLLGINVNTPSTSDAQQAYSPLMFPGDEQGQLLPREQWPVSRILRGEVLREAVMDIMLYLEDGREVILNVSGAPMRDSQGLIVGAITVLRNVTERRGLEMRTREALSSLLAMAEAIVQFFSVAEDTPVGTQEPAPLVPGRVEQLLVELTRSILGCLCIAIASVEPESGVMHSLAVAGLLPGHESQWWLDLQSSTLSDYFTPPILARLYADEEVLLDLAKDSLVNRSDYGLRSVLIVPLRLGNRLTGILGIEQSSRRHEYTGEEIELIRGIARMTALVIERQRLLHEQAQARAGELALREVNQRMNEFLSIASHELRTPLAVIKGNVQLVERRLQRLARQTGTTSEQLLRQMGSFQALFEETNDHTRLLDRLVGDLLNASRASNNQLAMHAAPCDLASIVRKAFEEQRLIAPTRMLRLEIVPEGAVPIMADSDRIKQVVMNYLNNALKYSEQDRPVKVYLTVEGTEARVSVRDQGSGLADEELKRVWERFYRVRRAEMQGGLGLGLYICSSIIQWHEGQVGVQSAPGKGSTFWFTLPLTK
ncbi:MAG: ATP-binding protein [Ktedonobacteraceae bacterium]